ncbi:MAG: MFS transporter [Candidatus Rokuibacteriota bacterium]|nr:MAG: MFS transporter [Candidatus Rokubacteria bacterium]
MTTDVRPTASRCAVSALFFVNGAILASWVPYVPMVKQRLGIGDGLLGVVLLFMAIGALGALPFAGTLVGRLGSRTVSVGAGLGLCLSLPLPILAPTPFLVALALLFFGAFNSTLDVAMNAQAVEVEQRRGRALMSSFHAMFSVGGLAGALLSSVIAAAGVGAADHILAAALLGSVAILIARSALIAVAPSPSPVFVRPTRGLLGLGVLALCALLAEGAIGDWSAVYLMDSRGASQSVAAAGFAAFSLAMAGGRFAGDHVVRWLGAACLLRLSGALAAGGLLLALIVKEPVIAIAGFGLVGRGVANLIPVIFSAAGRAYAVAPGHGLAAVATTGYVGFLAGPPAIGLAAEVAGLPAALGIVALACAAVAIAARLAGDRIPTRK